VGEVVEALKELSGQVMPDQALDVLSELYLGSNLDEKMSSWTKISGELGSIQSSCMGVERKPIAKNKLSEILHSHRLTCHKGNGGGGQFVGQDGLCVGKRNVLGK
jgi:hypothetical protein